MKFEKGDILISVATIVMLGMVHVQLEMKMCDLVTVGIMKNNFYVVR